jgi:hypothetical protein
MYSLTALVGQAHIVPHFDMTFPYEVFVISGESQNLSTNLFQHWMGYIA